MFSVVSVHQPVILSGGSHMAITHDALDLTFPSTPLAMFKPGSTWTLLYMIQLLPPNMLKRAVCILLECFLVLKQPIRNYFAQPSVRRTCQCKCNASAIDSLHSVSAHADCGITFWFVVTIRLVTVATDNAVTILATHCNMRNITSLLE